MFRQKVKQRVLKRYLEIGDGDLKNRMPACTRAGAGMIGEWWVARPAFLQADDHNNEHLHSWWWRGSYGQSLKHHELCICVYRAAATTNH